LKLLLVGVRGWVLLELFHASPGAFDVCRGHSVLLRQGVTEDGTLLVVEEVQDAVIDAATLGPQLVDTVSQVIGCGAPQFVSHVSKSLDRGAAACVRDFVSSPQLLQEIDDWNITERLLIENYARLGQDTALRLSQY